MRLVEVGRALEQFRAGFTPKRIPVEMGCLPGADHLIDLRGRRFERRADGDSMVMGGHNRPALALSEAGFRGPAAGFKGFQSLEQWLANQWVTKVNPGTVA